MMQYPWQKDPQDCVPAGWCFVCGGEVYDGNPIYIFRGHWVCPACLKEYFASRLCLAERGMQK